ncbi:YceI family protein [Catalinimonas niigatensis]|uniref:YceI family protein n=1 Tax=Catalinimonas niigatensis TaxID=1397264 RepID=UPI002664E5BA|nr:YceI family protein [Catalinimonas niigatensis]WPP50150.1 YceI family protein [Catalinimonas niigatensis]
MKKSIYIFALNLIFIFVSLTTYAQATYQLTDESKMVIKGTSSLHDWESDVTELQGRAQVSVQDQQPQFQNFTLTVPVKSIKSGKNAMDKNTYEAMEEDQHPTIQFNLNDIQRISDGKITATGKLTIAGQTKPVTLHADYQLQAQDQLNLQGSYSFRMTEYGIAPPTAVFGTIKTGDEITIDYHLTLQKSK